MASVEGLPNDEKDEKPKDGRWIRPPLSFNERKNFSEMSVRLEKILSKAEEDDDDDEDEEKPKKEDVVQAVVETDKDDQAAEQPPEEVFETITAAKDTELMDIPRIEEDKPSVALTPEESKAFNEMAAEFGPTESDDAERKDIPPIPSWEMPTVEHPRKDLDEASPEPPSTSSRAPFWRPSPAPAFSEAHTPTSSAFESRLTPTASHSGGGELSSGFTAALETLKAFTDLAELANNPNRLVTRVLTQVAVEGYLNRRKQERYGSEPLLRQQREEIDRLHEEQRRINERVASNAQREAITPDQELEIFDQDGNRIILQPGWQVRRGAAGYSFVVDQNNRVVHNAIHYGEAFKREQQRERLNDDLLNMLGVGGSSSGTQSGTQNDHAFPAPFPTTTQMQQTPQTNNQLMLPSQPHEVDINHRLPEPRNSLRDVVFSPWLWTAVAILIIVYFIAQLA